MRKLSLLAAAAMVAGGSAFAMDGGGVSISGEANFGVKFKENDGGANAPNELQFHHEFDIKFSASGTTDGGIGFGGSVSIDNTESVTSAATGGKAAQERKLLEIEPLAATTAEDAATLAGTENANAVFFTAETPVPAADIVVVTDGKGKISAIEAAADNTLGANHFKVNVKEGDVIYVTGTGADQKIMKVSTAGDYAVWVARGDYLFKTGKGDGPMTAATAATFNPDAKQKVDNHGEVYISMDMHKLTIGSDLDAADKLAGGLADPGFDGIGIDDVAEGVWGGSAADVRYDGDFGVASVAISYGDNAGDADWAAGFSFNVEPVTFGAGFDSNGVMSIGMGFTQGQIAMNALYSTDSDHDEADNEAMAGTAITSGENREAVGAGAVSSDGVHNFKVSNMPDLKNQAIGVDMTYQMTEATSLVLVAAQSKKESAAWYYKKPADNAEEADAVKEAEWKKSSTTVDAFGVGFSHDLGGGATLKAGAGSVDSEATADLGITMKF